MFYLRYRRTGFLFSARTFLAVRVLASTRGGGYLLVAAAACRLRASASPTTKRTHGIATTWGHGH
jgi:hypothetical protein